MTTQTEPRWNNLTPNQERVLDLLLAGGDRRLKQFPSGRWAVCNRKGSLLGTGSLTPPEFIALQYEGFVTEDGEIA